MANSDESRLREVNPVIPVRDMALTLAYYEEKLGFGRAFDNADDPDGPIDYAGVQRDGLTLHLQAMSEGEGPTMPLIRIRVDNIEPLYEEYAAMGVVAPGGHLEAKPWGTREFGLYDPNSAALIFYEDL
jgi:catechol 2,3-dioxygenase-like lactoylglutathione lyase family enzyme